MEIYCTRPGCPRPRNYFADLDAPAQLRTVREKFCTACGMPLILDNRYVTTRLLGKGGFGAAFLALDRRTPNLRPCVVKQFQPAASLTPDQLRIAQGLFEREAEVLEQLGNQHPQIPDLMAFFPLDVAGRTSGQPDQFFYIVQEFVDGINMEDELEQRGRFSEAETLEILTEMLKVLQFVHENGSIHRDIKPSNIMRRRDGRLFLLDFGAVKQVTTAGQPARSATGIYTEGFAPPEQRSGKEVYPSTDLYALAVTCLMLLTGKQPDELHDAFTNTWNWRAYAQVSDRLEAVLNRMLLPTPSQRFAQAQEALIALQDPSAPLKPLMAPPSPAPALPTVMPAASNSPAAKPPTPNPPIKPTTSSASQSTTHPATHQSATQVQSTPPPVQPSAAVAPPAHSPPVALAPRPAFSLAEVLSGAAFTGFEGGLVAIAVASLLGTAGLSPLFWLVLLGVMVGMVVAQSRRWLEKVDLLIVAGLTLLLIWFFPASLLHRIILLPPLNAMMQALGLGRPILMILLIASFAALLAIAATAVFRLIYNLVSRLL